ncbi:MAG: hypothetical protein K0Q81_1817, partial [Paenibacillus sp.]|nr:hypothetical protein [Paenibacillus sp.]
MRFTVQYIPLSKIKPDVTPSMTARIRELRNRMWDCMHLLVVRKNSKDGSYRILLGNDRYEFMRAHTKKLVAPCLVDESKSQAQIKSWFLRFRSKRLSDPFPDVDTSHITPVAWSILREFLRKEPRLKQLSRKQQIQIMFMAIQYKKIVVASM